MIKKLIAGCAMALLPLMAYGQPTLAVWDVDLIDAVDVDNIKLDIRTDGAFFMVNGTVNTSTNAGNSAIGSCYLVVIGDVVCELQVREYWYRMTIRENLNGTLEIFRDGSKLDDGNLIYRP